MIPGVSAKVVLLVAIGVLLAITGCRSNPPVREHAEIGKPGADEPRSFAFKGTVKKIRKEAKRVYFDHDDIPGYMPAMNDMGFALQADADYDRLHIGDRIEATLRIYPDNRKLLGDIDILASGSRAGASPNAN